MKDLSIIEIINRNSQLFIAANIEIEGEVEDVVIGETIFEEAPEIDLTPDPTQKILLIMIGVVIVAMLITSVLIKQSRKNRVRRSREFVESQNKKMKEKQTKEKDDLSNIMNSYQDEYSDENIDKDANKIKPQEIINEHKTGEQAVQMIQQPVVQPMYAQPVQPVYPQPMYAQPVQPVYPQPMYAQPVQPVYQQPVYAQPVQPVYPQPPYPGAQAVETKEPEKEKKKIPAYARMTE